jgi:hypothetical protein
MQAFPENSQQISKNRENFTKTRLFSIDNQIFKKVSHLLNTATNDLNEV